MKERTKELFLVAGAGWALAGAAHGADFLIVPGQRIGALRLPAREADVEWSFPGQVRAVWIAEGEGDLVRGSEIFPCDPARNATLKYVVQGKQRLVGDIEFSQTSRLQAAACQGRGRPGHAAEYPPVQGTLPGDTLDPYQYDPERYDAQDDTAPDALDDAKIGALPESFWHLANGVRVGMDLRTLEQLNGKPFDIAGHEGDGVGGVQDWRGGKLADCRWAITFGGALSRIDNDTGQKFHSDDAALRGKRSWVDTLEISMTEFGDSYAAGCLKGRLPGFRGGH